MPIPQHIKHLAYKLDPECWQSYSGKDKPFKQAMDLRRTASMAKAQRIMEGRELWPDGMFPEIPAPEPEPEPLLIPNDWTPTADNVNALPEPLRRYIHDIETNCDPAGMVRENFQLRQENELLRKECERLSKGIDYQEQRG